MARVVVAPTAVEDLRQLIEALHLPSDARARVRDRLHQLGRFPNSGPRLTGRWDGFRFVLGPWRWMLIVYMYDQAADRVSVVTIRDSRTAGAATGGP